MLLTVLLLFDKVSSGSPKPGNKHNSELTFVFYISKKVKKKFIQNIVVYV